MNIAERVQAAHLDSLNRHRILMKQQRLEAQEQAAKEQEVSVDNYFSEQALPNNTKLNSVEQDFKHYALQEQSFVSGGDDASFDPNLLNNVFTAYLEDAEVDTIFEYVDKENKLTREKSENLLDSLLSMDEDVADSELSGFVKGNKLSMAETYILLGFLYEEISKRDQKKKRLLKLLRDLLKKVGQQNSAYLFEFFSLANHPQVKNNPKLANGLANLAAGTGEANIATVREAISFIKESLENDFANIVSKCMRLRVHILSRLTQSQNSFENKQEVANFMKFEKNLIVVNTMNVRVNSLKDGIAATHVWDVTFSDDHASILEAIISFAESTMVTELGIKNLIRGFGISKNMDELVGFRNKIIQFFSSMPVEIFNGQDSHRQKLIHGLRNSFNFTRNDKKEVNFDFFIKPKKILLQYV